MDMETLPCGCKIGTGIENGVKTIFYKPCFETCKYYAYMIEEGRKRAITIERREI